LGIFLNKLLSLYMGNVHLAISSDFFIFKCSDVLWTLSSQHITFVESIPLLWICLFMELDIFFSIWHIAVKFLLFEV